MHFVILIVIYNCRVEEVFSFRHTVWLRAFWYLQLVSLCFRLFTNLNPLTQCFKTQRYGSPAIIRSPHIPFLVRKYQQRFIITNLIVVRKKMRVQ